MLTVGYRFKDIDATILLDKAIEYYCPTLFSLINPLTDWNKAMYEYQKLDAKRKAKWKVDSTWEGDANFYDLIVTAAYNDPKSITFLASFDKILKELIYIIPKKIQINFDKSVHGRITNIDDGLNYMTVFGELFALHNVLSKGDTQLVEMDSSRVSNLICTEYLHGEHLTGDYDYKLYVKKTRITYLAEIGNILNIKIEKIKNDASLISTLRKSIKKKIKQKTKNISKDNLKYELYFIFVIFVSPIKEWARFEKALLELEKTFGEEFNKEYRILSFLTYVRTPIGKTNYLYEMDSISNFIDRYNKHPSTALS